MIRPAELQPRPGRPGITLTECLIGIMIMGVGLVSVATLFPIGLLRLQEAQRQSRSALLFESAAADMAARNLVSAPTFRYADLLNAQYGLPLWYPCTVSNMIPNGIFNPLIQDASAYGGEVYSGATADTLIGLDASNTFFNARGSAGLPFAYDPLWRYKVVYPGNAANTNGVYQHDVVGGTQVVEARFGSGLGFVRTDPSGGLPSAHGLQRLTNFNGRIYDYYTDSAGKNYPLYVMQSTNMIPKIFVSPEDVVWNSINNPFNLSTVLPDRTLTGDGSSVNDWRFTWMFTGRLSSSSNAATFDGDLVILENRPFALEQVTSPLDGTTQILKPADETVVEAVFGYSATVSAAGSATVGYGAAADRTVLLRWPSALADPIVRNGDWICDVTYERQQLTAFDVSSGAGRFVGVPNPLNGGKWDNLPAQRGFWYQVVKVSPAIADSITGYRSMVVQVGSTLRARTPLNMSDASPATVNAALINPYVVNVIPQTIVVH